MPSLSPTISHSRGDALLSRLNEAQRRAAMHGLGDAAASPGPLLVIAGAGTGKTATLAARAACLVAAGTDPSRLLMLTFSRRAALDMERRVGRALQQAFALPATAAPPRLPWCGTFHSIGARLLRAYALRLGLDESFTVDDRGDSEDALHLLRQRLGLAGGSRRFPQKGTCAAIYSRVVNSQKPLLEVLGASFPWCADRHDDLKRLFAAYAEEKQAQRILDFDDLLVCWAEAMAEPALAEAIGGRFDHVLVDEYQDTNRLQEAIVLALRPQGCGLTVVGDDAQAIYSFRAAEVRNILDFAGRFAPPAHVVALEQNYRSTPALLAASNAVIALARERHAKRLWSAQPAGESPSLVWVEDEAAQACWVAERMLALRESGLTLKNQAVLFRTAHHSNALELELARRNIPFVKYGGLKFLDAAHVKDVLAVLRFAANPRGQRAALRALQLVPGVGTIQASRLLAALASSDDALAVLLAHVPSASGAAPWLRFAELFAALRAPSSRWPDEMVAIEAWYLPLLERMHDDASTRAADVVQLCRLANGYASRQRFLTELTLDPPAATSDEPGAPKLDEDYVVLSTIHSAKGQEWRAVSLLNVVDGCIPSEMATGSAGEIEEERRLLYVAMTRAKDHLHLLVPGRFYVTQQAAYGDRHVYAAITRFIPPPLRALFTDVRPAQPELATEIDACASAATAIDVAARVRSRWA